MEVGALWRAKVQTEQQGGWQAAEVPEPKEQATGHGGSLMPSLFGKLWVFVIGASLLGVWATCLVRELQREQAHGMLFQAAFRHLGKAEEVCEVTLVHPHPSVGL